MSTVQAIERAIPILHCGPGCAQKLSNSAGSSGFFSPNIFPCTSVNERDVVFGGEKKLRSTIESALKIIDADLYIVLTGCTAEIVGDTVDAHGYTFEVTQMQGYRISRIKVTPIPVEEPTEEENEEA